MKDLKNIETRINLPTSDKLNIKFPTFQQPQYNYESLPSSQSLSVESRFICQETTSVGPMYYQS